MRIRFFLLTVVLGMLPSLTSMAGGQPTGAMVDANSELALRLFAERERTRSAQLPYGVYPMPDRFSAQALEQQNRAMFYWLWQPDSPPIWPLVPYWPPAYPMGWPIIYPWMSMPLQGP